METITKMTRKEKIAAGIPKVPTRKSAAANARKEAKRSVVQAKLMRSTIAPRKMRLVVDQIRNQDLQTALAILKISTRAASVPLHKLVLSAISNWQQRFPDANSDLEDLYIKEIQVGEAGMLKRFQPAPQGRAHRIRKRLSHVTLTLGSLSEDEANVA
jgi:large subunit ribosomal protein L22